MSVVRYLKRRPVQADIELPGGAYSPKGTQSHHEPVPCNDPAKHRGGLALVQAQALACGCPVIGTRHTGSEDLFTDGQEGFIVPIRDPRAIVDRLQLLADVPARRAAMSEAALQRVKALGGWTEYGNQMAYVMKNLVE